MGGSPNKNNKVLTSSSEIKTSDNKKSILKLSYVSSIANEVVDNNNIELKNKILALDKAYNMPSNAPRGVIDMTKWDKINTIRDDLRKNFGVELLLTHTQVSDIIKRIEFKDRAKEVNNKLISWDELMKLANKAEDNAEAPKAEETKAEEPKAETKTGGEE